MRIATVLWGMRAPASGTRSAQWGSTLQLPHTPLCPQTMVTEQAAKGSSPPDLRVQYLHQIHANHQVSPSAGVRHGPTQHVGCPNGIKT